MSSNRNRIGPGLDKKNKTACASVSCKVVCQDWFWRAALLFFILTREGGHSAPLSVSSALTQTDRNRGEGGKERKGKVLLRPDQPRTLQVSINHWTGYLKRVSLWSDGDAEWRSVFLKCLLWEIFRMFSHLRSSDTKCCFVTAHARKSLTSVYAPTYKPCSRNPSCTSSASSSSSWLGNKRPFHSKILWIYEL